MLTENIKSQGINIRMVTYVSIVIFHRMCQFPGFVSTQIGVKLIGVKQKIMKNISEFTVIGLLEKILNFCKSQMKAWFI